jgi:hypothetical protein
MKGKDMPDFVKEYKNEVVQIQQYIFENEPIYKKLGIVNAKKKQELYKTKSSNELGSTMNIMLCDIENNISQTMIKYLQKKKIISSSLVMVFDGFMILKDDVQDIDVDDLLRKLEKIVYEKLNYKIHLDVKPMNDIINVPEDYKPKNQLSNKYADDYEECKSKFEKIFFKIRFPISFGVINHQGDVTPHNRQQLVTQYENLQIRKYDKKGEINLVPFVSEWLKDQDMRTYDQIDFLPMQEVPPNIYNTFTDYKVMDEKIKFDDSLNVEDSLIYKHLKTIVIKKVEKCSSSSLFKRFNDYLEKYNINAKYSIQAFGRDINKYEGIDKTKSNIINYVFDIKKLKEYLNI